MLSPPDLPLLRTVVGRKENSEASQAFVYPCFLVYLYCRTTNDVEIRDFPKISTGKGLTWFLHYLLLSLAQKLALRWNRRPERRIVCRRENYGSETKPCTRSVGIISGAGIQRWKYRLIYLTLSAWSFSTCACICYVICVTADNRTPHPSLPLVPAILSPFFRFCLHRYFWGAAGSEEMGNEKVGAEAEAGIEALWPVGDVEWAAGSDPLKID